MQTVMMALSRAFAYSPPNKPGVLNAKKGVPEPVWLQKCKEMEASVKQAICEFPHYGEVCRALLDVGDEH